MYKNTLDILRQTVKNEGVLALYKGERSPRTTGRDIELISQAW